MSESRAMHREEAGTHALNHHTTPHRAQPVAAAQYKLEQLLHVLAMAEAEKAAFATEHARLVRLLQQQGNGEEVDLSSASVTTTTTSSSSVVPRYIRLRRPRPTSSREQEEEEQATREVIVAAGGRAVTWCPAEDKEGFYALPAAFRLAQWPLYQQGRVYGMDVASGVAVWALGPQPGEDVLDLCCCPGLKLCMLAEQMRHEGTVTGVDISRTRLTVCRQVLLKYQIGRHNFKPSPSSSPSASTSSSASPSPSSSSPSATSSSFWCRLLCADGCSFQTGPKQAWAGSEEEVLFDSRAYDWEGMEARGQKRMNRGTRRKELQALCALLDQSQEKEGEREGGKEEERLYDRVLVDADCTHDGSTRHMEKVAGMEESIKTRQGGFLSREKLGGLEALQRGLISNGFRLLRPGGVLVYSTCSLSPRQNEAVVTYLLETEGGKAVLDPIVELGEPLFSSLVEEEEGEGGREGGREAGPGRLPCRWGSLPGTLVFEPRFGETSGLFIARIRKKEGGVGGMDRYTD